MRYKCWIPGLLVIGIVGAASLPGKGQEGPDPGGLKGKKIALLIGIDGYAAPQLEGRRLNGCVNDVNAVATLLPNFGFAGEGKAYFHVLRNEQATRAAILAEFDRVVGEAQDPQDLVYIHVSSHGSQTPDVDVPGSGVLKKDETDGDGMDETIIAHDSRALGPDKRAVPDIVDDEIYARLLRPLSQKTKNVVAVFDSCHSGDIGRDPLLQARWVEPAQQGIENREIAARGRNGLFQEELDCVLITACESAQVARERAFEEGTRGIFTHFWIKELQALLAGDPQRPTRNEATYLSVVEQVQSQVEGLPGGQRPVVQGKLKKTVFFGIEQREPRPYIRAEWKDDYVLVRGGAALGFTKGSVFGLFRPGTVDFNDASKRIVEAELYRVDDLLSFARVRGDATGRGLSALPAGVLHAIEIVHKHEGLRFPVAVVGDRGAEPLRTLVEKLGGYEGIEVVDPIRRKRPATITVRRYRPEGEHEDKIQLEESTSSEAGRAVEVLSGPYPVSDRGAVDRLIKAITGWCRWDRVLNLENPNASPDTFTKLDIRPTKADAAGREPGVFVEGEDVEFSLTTRSLKPVYVGILNLSDNGEIKLIFKSGQPLESGTRSLGVAQADMLEGRAAERGRKREWIRVLATLDPMPFEMFEMDAIKDELKPAIPDPLFDLLAEAVDVEHRVGPPVQRTKWVTSKLQTVTRKRD